METHLSGNKDVDQRCKNFPQLHKVFAGFKDVKKDLEKRAIPSEEEAIENFLYDIKSKIFEPSFKQKERNQKIMMGDFLAAIGMPSELFWMYKEIAHHYFDAFSNSIHKETTDPCIRICSCIRDIFRNYTDCSEMFAESLAKDTQMFGHYANDLDFIRKNEYETLSDERKSYIQAVSTLHNCGRHRIPRKCFEVTYINKEDKIEYKIESILKPFSNCEDKEVQLLATFARSYMMTTLDLKNNLVTDKFFLNHLMEFLCEATESSDRRFKGFSVAELLNFTAQITKNNSNREMIGKVKCEKFDKSIFDIIRSALESKDEEEHITALETIWELSFYNEHAYLFYNDKELMDIINSFEKSRLQEEVNAAQAARFQITEAAGKLIEKTKESSKTCLKFMISYNHKHKERVHKIFDILKDIGFSIWIDKEKMIGNMVDKMATAVWTSDVIFVCMSEYYETSRFCQTEAMYAHNKNKDIFLLKMDKSYNPPKGCWLHAIKSLDKFYVMNEELYKTNIKLLVEDLIQTYKDNPIPLSSSEEKLQKYLGISNETKQVQDFHPSKIHMSKYGAASNEVLVPDPTPKVRDTCTNNIEKAIYKASILKTWGNVDLEQWIFRHELNRIPGANMPIHVVQFLLQLYICAPDTFYNLLKEELNIHELGQLMKISNAFEELVD